MRGFRCFSPTRSGYGHGCMSDHPLMIFAPSSSKAVTDGFEGVRLLPSVNIHMAVGEADSRPAFVVRARGMPVIASSLNGDPEGGHANAFRLQVDEKKSFRWLIGFYIRSFGKISMAR